MDKKILVIDDEIDVVEMIKDGLEYEGYKVFTALNGKEGIKKAKEIAPDLITVDIQMPDMSGFEVIENLKNDSRTKNIPIFILSVRDFSEEQNKGFLLGVREYIVKPFSLKTLAHEIEKQVQAASNSPV